MKKMRWRIKDLIDLEYFLGSDEVEGDESALISLAGRDRAIYLQHIQPLEDDGQSLSHGRTIRAWLERRREMEKSESGPGRMLPGEAYEEIYRVLGYGFLISGLMTGSSLAFSFLIYRGTEPLNVSSYLGGFVLTQVFLLLLLMVMTLIRIWRRSPLRSSVIYVFISGLIVLLIEKLKRRAFKTFTGSKRDRLEAVMGLVKGKRQVYGSLFYWPVFMLAQIFMIGFSLGVLAATLLKVTGADIAFGWQSTVQFSTEWVFELVRAIALPWSWFVPPEIAYPSLSRIAGSHMVLKDGIYYLATEDLVSWWPFLCFAVFFYGLVPRLLLLLFGLFSQGKALGRIDFRHGACDRLLRRLMTPLVSTEGHPAGGEPSKTQARMPGAALPGHGESWPDGGLIALIPDEIFETCPEDALERVVAGTLGYPIRQKFRFGDNEAGDQRVLDELSLKNMGKAPSDILIIQEAWQPLINENLRFIKALRRAMGKFPRIRVGLIGRPRRGHFFTQVKEADWKAWEQKISALGDPYLGMERLVVNDVDRDS